MRIFMKAVASTATVGLLAFGAVAGSGGAAFAGSNPYSLITGCTTSVDDNVAVGFVPNCTAISGTIGHPNTSIFVELEETKDTLGALIDDQSGQGFEASWSLVCDVNGTPVTTPGSYVITSTLTTLFPSRSVSPRWRASPCQGDPPGRRHDARGRARGGLRR
jgi:hypothetical protein